MIIILSSKSLHTCFLFCLFDLILYVPVNNLSDMSGRVFLGLTSTKQGLMYLAHGHKAVTPVRQEPAALPSEVKHSTTEPSHCASYDYIYNIQTSR